MKDLTNFHGDCSRIQLAKVHKTESGICMCCDGSYISDDCSLLADEVKVVRSARVVCLVFTVVRKSADGMEYQ